MVDIRERIRRNPDIFRNKNIIPPPKPCDSENARMLLSIVPTEITMNLLKKWFGGQFDKATGKVTAMIDYRGEMKIPLEYRDRLELGNGVLSQKGEKTYTSRHARNWEKIEYTTPGRYVVNTLLFSYSANLRSLFDYINEPFNSGVIQKIEQKMVDFLLERKINVDEHRWVLDCLQWLGYGLAALTCPSLTVNTIRMPKETRALKTSLIKSELGRKIIEDKDLNSMSKLEKELLNNATDILFGVDPGMEIYQSGAKGALGNNYKNVAIARGAIKDSAQANKIAHISLASLDEGIPADEMNHYANILVLGTFGRSMLTAIGGYYMKQLNAAFQVVQQNKDFESDCGTTKYLTIKIEDPNDYKYRFVINSSGKLEEIVSENMHEFKGKTVKLRSPQFCKSEKVCTKCAGTLFLRMSISNIGLLVVGQGNGLMMTSMKAFHDSTIKIQEINVDDYLHFTNK